MKSTDYFCSNRAHKQNHRTEERQLVDVIFEPQVQKITVFTYRSPHFCFPWGRPWGNHAKCYMDGKRIRCLQIVSQYVRIYLQQFPSLNRKCKKSPFSRTAAHIFVSPGDASVTITQYVVWMERQFNACQTLAACTYLSSIVSELYDA